MMVQTLLEYPLVRLTSSLKTPKQRAVIAAEAGRQLVHTLGRIHNDAQLLHNDLSLKNIVVGRLYAYALALGASSIIR